MAARTSSAIRADGERPARDGVGDRRQALVRAASQLIAERGFAGLRAREVAARVGINHATLHYYFPSKEALIAGVVDHIMGHIRTLRDRPAPGAAGTPRDLLRDHFAKLRYQFRAMPELFAVLTDLQLRAERDPTLFPILREADEGWYRFLVETLAEGVARGQFRADLDPPVTARLIMATFKGLSAHTASWADARDRVVEHLEDLLAAGRPLPRATGMDRHGDGRSG